MSTTPDRIQHYSLHATFGNTPVVFNTHSRWSVLQTDMLRVSTFNEALTIYNRLIEIGTRATDIVIYGELS